MLARTQNTTPGASHFPDVHCRRAFTRANLSYRRILHDCPTNQRRIRMRQLRRCKTSRDPLSPSCVKGAVKLSMTPAAIRNGSKISLPRFLQRPAQRPIDIQALQQVCPELSNVADTFVRKHLTSMAPNMLAGVESTRIIRRNTSELPNELTVVFNDNATIPTVTPTHVLALSTPTQTDKSNYTLFLIHQLPFAANCSSFPVLPSSSTATPAGSQSSSATLPVVRASLPSINAFPLFQMYLYMKDPEALRATFLPKGWECSVDSIIQRAVLIKGFWSNACALGTFEDELYDVIEDCWAEVLHMLERTTNLV